MATPDLMADPDRSPEEHEDRQEAGDEGPEEPLPGVEAIPDEEENAGPTPLAELVDVTKSYGDAHALGPVSLALEGSCVALLGPNGAGKTTFIRLLMGLLPPSAGHLRVLGDPVVPGSREVRQRIGYVPEGEAVFPGLNGVGSVAYAGRLQGMSATDAMQRAHQVLDYVGLGDERYRLAASYSTGMRQKLKLAQALVHDPELLILDEPTEGVDPGAREHIMEMITDLASEHGLKVLISTHILADVERLASHAIVLDQGRVVTHGTLDELRRSGTPGYVVRVNGDPAPLTAKLDAAGVTWHSMTPNIRVEVEDPREVLRYVKEAGLVVRHLAPVQLRLDEAFEQAVGGGAPA